MSSPILPGRFHFVGALPGNPQSTCYACYLDVLTLSAPSPEPPILHATHATWTFSLCQRPPSDTPVSVLPALPSQELRFHMHACRGARVASRIKNCSNQRTPRSVAPACARTDLLGEGAHVASRTANCQDSERELAPATPCGQK